MIREADTVLCDSETRARLAGTVGFEGKQIIGGYGGLSRFTERNATSPLRAKRPAAK